MQMHPAALRGLLGVRELGGRVVDADAAARARLAGGGRAARLRYAAFAANQNPSNVSLKAR